MGTYVASDLPERFAAIHRHRRRPVSAARTAASAGLGGFVDVTAQSDERPSIWDARCWMRARRAVAKPSARTLRSFGRHHLGYADPRGMLSCAIPFATISRPHAGTVRTLTDRHHRGHAASPRYRDRVMQGRTRSLDRRSGHSFPSLALVAAGAQFSRYRSTNLASACRSHPSRAKGACRGHTLSHQFPKASCCRWRAALNFLHGASSGAGSSRTTTPANSDGGRPLASLQGLDQAERVTRSEPLTGAFSGTSARLRGAANSLLPAFVTARYPMDRQPPTLRQAVVAAFMEQVLFSAHIETAAPDDDQRHALVAARQVPPG